MRRHPSRRSTTRPLAAVLALAFLLVAGGTGLGRVAAQDATPVTTPVVTPVATPLVTPGGAAPLLYIALGDSYASGQGLDDSGDCRVSSKAYPDLVAADLPGPAALLQLACSGASAGPNEDPRRDLSAQVTTAESMIRASPGTTALVTISIGINDFHVSDELLGRLADPEEDTASFIAWVDGRLPGIRDEIAAAVARLVVAGDTRVVLVTYPNPVPLSQLQCEGPGGSEGDDCYRRAAYLFDGLNGAIAAAADPAALGAAASRVAVTTGLAARFEGHDCLALWDGSWFQTLGSLLSGGLELGRFLGVDWSVGDCAHPNEDGQEAIAEEVLAVALPLLGLPPAPAD